MRFKKIKYNVGEVTLLWTTDNEGVTHAHELTSDQAPHPDFIDALQALVADLRRICELPESYEEDLRIQSVSLSQSEKTGANGAVITGLKAIAATNAPFVLHTPHLVGETESGVLPNGLQERLETLKSEASAYIGGKRAQGELFAGTAATSGAETAGV